MNVQKAYILTVWHAATLVYSYNCTEQIKNITKYDSNFNNLILSLNSPAWTPAPSPLPQRYAGCQDLQPLKVGIWQGGCLGSEDVLAYG